MRKSQWKQETAETDLRRRLKNLTDANDKPTMLLNISRKKTKTSRGSLLPPCTARQCTRGSGFFLPPHPHPRQLVRPPRALLMGIRWLQQLRGSRARSCRRQKVEGVFPPSPPKASLPTSWGKMTSHTLAGAQGRRLAAQTALFRVSHGCQTLVRTLGPTNHRNFFLAGRARPSQGPQNQDTGFLRRKVSYH